MGDCGVVRATRGIKESERYGKALYGPCFKGKLIRESSIA